MDEETLFAAALEKNSPAERFAFLDRACEGNSRLRSRVEALLKAHDDAGSFLQTPALPQAGEAFGRAVAPTAAAERRFASSNIDPHADASGADEEVSLDFLEPLASPEQAGSTAGDGLLGKLGPYLITEVVGRGGMGVVLKGQDPKLNRVVAIKVPAVELAANVTARKRFLREAQAAAAVSHDHVVTIHAIDVAGPMPYIVMEYIAGCSLQQRIDRSGPLEVKTILRIARQTALGLAAAHEQGLIHRDVKPANILLENGVERVKLTDFGLARAVDDVGTTQTGLVAGTPQYMSPEQAQGQYVDHRSDLFSLGCVLYAMCTGRSPFRGDGAIAVLRRVCDDTPRSIAEINADIPPPLIQLIDRLLEKRPEDRFQSADEVAELAAKYLAHLQQPSQVPLPELIAASDRAAGGRRRRDALAAAASTVPKRSSGPGRRLGIAAAVAGVLLLSLGWAEATGVTDLSQTIVRVVTGQGTLVLEVDDPAVSVQIDGEELVIRGAGVHELRVRPGKHQVQAVKDGNAVHQELVTITRGGKQVVRVNREAALPDDLLGRRLLPPDLAAGIQPDPAAGLKAVAQDLMGSLADELPGMSDEQWQEFRDEFLPALADQPELLEWILDDERSELSSRLQARLGEAEWNRLLERYLEWSIEQFDARMVALSEQDWQRLRERSLWAIREMPSYRRTVLSMLKLTDTKLPPDASPEQLADEWVRAVRELGGGKWILPQADDIDGPPIPR